MSGEARQLKRATADEIIDAHITAHGPWARCTPEASLKFLRRTGRKYHLEVRKDAKDPG